MISKSLFTTSLSFITRPINEFVERGSLVLLWRNLNIWSFCGNAHLHLWLAPTRHKGSVWLSHKVQRECRIIMTFWESQETSYFASGVMIPIGSDADWTFFSRSWEKFVIKTSWSLIWSEHSASQRWTCVVSWFACTCSVGHTHHTVSALFEILVLYKVTSK